MSGTIGSLFSGIGGLELGLECAGFGPVVWQVEVDPFCRAVLAKHWPNVDRSTTDVRTALSLPAVDLICGGFPCQDVSSAGRGAGLAGDRSGLWFEFRRIVEELSPTAVVVENVASGKRRYLCQVRSDLQSIGYDTTAYQIAAADVGAPHRRRRIFVLAMAYANGDGQLQPQGGVSRERRRVGDGGPHVADAVRIRRAPWGSESTPRRTPEWHAEPGMVRGSDGISGGLDGHWWPAPQGAAQHDGEPPRVIEGRAPLRRARLKALGNAVVPQCAFVAGLCLRERIEAGEWPVGKNNEENACSEEAAPDGASPSDYYEKLDLRAWIDRGAR